MLKRVKSNSGHVRPKFVFRVQLAILNFSNNSKLAPNAPLKTTLMVVMKNLAKIVYKLFVNKYVLLYLQPCHMDLKTCILVVFGIVNLIKCPD